MLLGDTTSFARAPRSALLDVREELTVGIEDGGPPANWHHVAFTFTKGSVVGYVDGVIQTMKDMTFPPGTTLDLDVLAQLVVGAQSDGTGGFIGAIDDFRLYGRALDANAISELAK